MSRETKTSPGNLAYLTAKEHYIAHLLLVRMFSGKQKAQMAFALLNFARKNPAHERVALNARQYEIIRRIVGENAVTKLPEYRDNISKKLTGIVRGPRTEETKAKIREARLGKSNHPWKGKKLSEVMTNTEYQAHQAGLSERAKKQMSEKGNPFAGKTHSTDTKAGLSEKARNRWQGSPLVWVNNGLVSRRVAAGEAEELMALGWKRGRVMTKAASLKYANRFLDSGD